MNDYSIKQSSDSDTLEEAQKMKNIGNIDRAVQLYTSLAPSKYQIQAMRELGNLLDSQGDINSAIEWLKKAAIMDDVEAAYDLGIMLLYSAESDHVEAIKWLKMAATKGEVNAQLELGLYMKGQEAVYWLTKAYEQGNYSAGNLLAEHYLNGDGIEQNKAKAFSILKECSTINEVLTDYYHLGVCYYYGYGTTIDYSMALKYFEKSVSELSDDEYGLIISIDGSEYYMLGLCYYYGHGVEKNKEKAFELFEKAAENGNDLAKEYLT